MTIETASDLGTGRASLGQVLDFARAGEPFTASDVMASTNLTRSTTIDAIDTLVGALVLSELPNARAVGQYRSGRPARRFQLSPDLGVVIGIDVGDFHLTVQVADLAGTPIAHRRVPAERSDTPAKRRSRVLQLVESVFAETGFDRADVLAVCAGVAAPVARDGTTPVHPHGFWQRTNPGLAKALADWAPVVEIRNDALLAATAEGALGEAVGCSDYVALLAGERLGAGVVVDGHPLHGAHGGIGEFTAFDCVTWEGGSRGLGDVAGSRARAMLEAKDFRAGDAFSALVPEKVDAHQVLLLAAAGDPDATRLGDELARWLARIVAGLGRMFDPARVIVCGAVADGVEPILDTVRSALPDELHLPPPDLVRSKLGADVVIKGAVVTALRAARTKALPHLATQRLSAQIARETAGLVRESYAE